MPFMNSSLRKLVRNLADDDFKYLTEEFGSINFKLLKQKDAYPYEYIGSFKRFIEEKLPDKKCFCSSVKDGTTNDDSEKLDSHINNEGYLTCKKNRNECNMTNMDVYHDNYLKNDLLLLADVFEKFIDMRLDFYKLDPCNYFSFPGLSRDVMLKIVRVKLEKTSDINMYLFIEKGLRGGISYTATRYSEANNKHMKNYDPTKPLGFIEYLNKNNLYGWAMSGYLLYGGFQWLKNADKFDVNSISKNSPIGYILEVNLEYPDELHVLHNDYPLAPEKLEIPYDMLPGYCKKIADKYGIKVGDVKKNSKFGERN